MKTHDNQTPFGSGANPSEPTSQASVPANGASQQADRNTESANQPTSGPAAVFSDVRVDYLAKTAATAEGDQTGQLAASISAEQRASEQGGREAAAATIASVAKEKAETEVKLKSVRAEKERTEKKRKEPGKRRRLGLWMGLGLIVGTLVLAALILTENYGVGLALTDIGAFAVNRIGKGMLLSATAVTVGLAFSKAYPMLPPQWRRRSLGIACVGLLALLTVYVFGFTIGARDSGAQSSAGFGIASSGGESATPAQAGLGSWLMLGSLLSMMSLTSFIGVVALKAAYDSLEHWVPNEDYVRLETQENLALGALGALETRGNVAAAELARFENEENRKIQFAMLRFQAWRTHFIGRGPVPPSVTTLLMAGMMFLGGCDDGGKSSAAVERMGGYAQSNSGPAEKVLAVSPRLDDEMRQQVAVVLESEAEYLATEAAVGSSLVMMDALKARPVAELAAVEGVQKIRRRAMMPQIEAVKAFIGNSARRSDQDGQMHLPRLAEVIGAAKLSPGSHVVMLGNPCWHTDKGADAFYSMKERYPSDGFLFEEPRDSVWSTKGREQRLAGLLIHIGYPTDDIFVDESHREAIRRFLTLYFQLQGATLVTFQPSLEAAMQAAREGLSDPVLLADADDKAAPMMIKIVRVEKQVEVPQDVTRAKAEKNDEAQDEAKKGISSSKDTQQAKLDEHGNPEGAEHDLGGKDSLKGQRILVVTFDHDEDIENSPLPDALRKKGAVVERVRYPLPQPAAWKAMLANTDQVWLWSSGNVRENHLAGDRLAPLVEAWRSGKLGLCLLADNTPYTQEAAKVLSAIAPGSRIMGDYQGEKVISARTEGSSQGFDSASPIFVGLDNVFEGNTISSITGNGLKPICWASNGLPLIVTHQQEKSGRLIAFGGFTSFYERFWDKAGTARLATNMAAWLAAKDVNGPKHLHAQKESFVRK